MKKNKLSYKIPYIVYIAIFFAIWLALLLVFNHLKNEAYPRELVSKEDYESFNDHVFYKFIEFMISTFSLLLIFPLYQSFYLYILQKRKVQFKRKYHNIQLFVWTISIIFSIVVLLMYLDQGWESFLPFATFLFTPILTVSSIVLGFLKIY